MIRIAYSANSRVVRLVARVGSMWLLVMAGRLPSQTAGAAQELDAAAMKRHGVALQRDAGDGKED